MNGTPNVKNFAEGQKQIMDRIHIEAITADVQVYARLKAMQLQIESFGNAFEETGRSIAGKTLQRISREIGDIVKAGVDCAELELENIEKRNGGSSNETAAPSSTPAEESSADL